MGRSKWRHSRWKFLQRRRKKMLIYSLYDRKLREFGGLVLGKNDESVRRAVHEGISPQSSVGKYPEDYDLKCVGEFDEESGVISGKVVRLVDNVADILSRGKEA